MTGRPIDGWKKKFIAAGNGFAIGVRTQNSFLVHGPIAIAVVAIAAWLRLEPWRWTALIVCIGSVIAAELFNSAIEELVRVLHPGRDQRIGRSLDMAAAGVLVLSIAAGAVGLIVIGPPLWNRVMVP